MSFRQLIFRCFTGLFRDLRHALFGRNWWLCWGCLVYLVRRVLFGELGAAKVLFTENFSISSFLDLSAVVYMVLLVVVPFLVS